jgi:hypothetical protein
MTTRKNKNKNLKIKYGVSSAAKAKRDDNKRISEYKNNKKEDDVE